MNLCKAKSKNHKNLTKSMKTEAQILESGWKSMMNNHLKI